MPPQLTGAERTDDEPFTPPESTSPPKTTDEVSAVRIGRLDLRSLWRNASWTTLALIVATVLALGETILLARFLGATVLGYFILIRTYPEAVQQVLDCRTRETMVKYLGEFVALDEKDRACALVRLVWLVDAAAGLIAMAIVFATASLAARYIVHDATVGWLVSLYAVSQFVGTLDSASGSVVRVFDRFGMAAGMGIYEAVAHFIGVLAVLLLGGGVTALVAVVVGAELLYTVGSAFVSMALLRRIIGFKIWGGLGAVRHRRKEILKFLLHTNISGTLKMSTDKLVMVIVGALGGAPTAALFKVASQAGNSLMLFTDPFYQVIYPPLSKLVARRQWTAVFGGVRRLQGVLFAVVLPLAAVVSGLIVVLISPIFGEEFSSAIWPAIVILWAVVPNVLFFWRRPLSLSLGLAGQLVKYRGAASGLQIAMTLALIRPLGIMGAAASMFVMQWLYALLEIRLVSTWRHKLLNEALAA